VSSNDNVARYFGAQASGYESDMMRSPMWRAIKTREIAAILDLLQPRAGERILDAGCGAGIFLDRLARVGCDSLGLDLSPEMVGEAVKRGHVARVADLASFRLAEQFDKILCAGVLEFCGEPDAVVGNLVKHLKPGGALLLFAPRQRFFCRLYRLFHQVSGAKVRVHLFSNRDVEQLATRHSLTVADRRQTFMGLAVLARRAPGGRP
jgi:2-polyprenyl-3-methyl-5-hydroxy-6-metoxy-1,4-benzoquinol methylase